MKQAIPIRTMVAMLILTVCAQAGWALGEEDFGHAALNAANFTDWPGIMSVVNHPSRVYHRWVNGNEYLYYQGDTAALNETLQKFTETKSAVREVVLRPGPGITHSFDGSKQISFGWSLHLIGGIAREMTRRDQGDKVWSPNPMLTIYVSSDWDLSKIKIPQGLTLLSFSALKQRTREGLKSTDQTVRGWSAGELAALDPYDTESLAAIAILLNDKIDWVRLNAVQAVSLFGIQAKPLLPQLRGLRTTKDTSLKDQLPKSIRSIEQAEDKAAAQQEHEATIEKIDRYTARQKR